MLFSEGSTPERNALISGGDERTLRTIISTTFSEGEIRAIFKKPNFLFGDVTLDTDQQPVAGEGQWTYTLNRDQYSLPSQKIRATIL